MAMPSAAEMLVDECAVPKVSYSLSLLCGKPEMPPICRSVGMTDAAAAVKKIVRSNSDLVLHASAGADAIVRRVEYGVDRHRQLHHPKRGPEMPAGGGHRVDRLRAQLVGKLRQLGALELADIGGEFDLVEQGSRGTITHGRACSRPRP